jgi:hypothetical protein
MSKGYNRRVTIDGVAYDSKFEYRILRETKLTEKHYHNHLVNYSVSSTHTYKPDFTVNWQKKLYHFEAKGRFNFRQDLNKYKHIVKEFAETNQELIFIFENPKTRTPGAKVRKDGSYQTNAEWADRQGIRWITIDSVDAFLDKEFS